MTERPIQAAEGAEKLRVSDHALVRFMERIRGINLDEYRAELKALVTTHEDNPPPMPGEFDDGIVIVIENLGLPVITTILGKGQRPKRKPLGTRFVHVTAPDG